MTQAEARLAEFDRRRDEKLAEMKAKKLSGRLVMYLDVRTGELMSGGEVDSKVKPWTGEEKP